ncbi:hypothetical protein [Acinetobacter soli]|uniref:hypothetical protein n=1 Tax=Acinetobacter soli TaxID=487316 RepID=UPI0012508E40|nr:hypothetical protein [Acinetobacter soli]
MSSKYDLNKFLYPHSFGKIQETIERLTDPVSKLYKFNAAISNYDDLFKALPHPGYAYKNHVLNKFGAVGSYFNDENLKNSNIGSVYNNEIRKKSLIESAINSQVLNKFGGVGSYFNDENLKNSNIGSVYNNEIRKKSLIESAINSQVLNKFGGVGSFFSRNNLLGLEADIKRLSAAKALMPELNTKISNLNEKFQNISRLAEQSHFKFNSESVQNYLDLIENFNEINNQNLQIDQATIHSLDLLLQQEETLELTTELKEIGILDTSSGSIFLDYSKKLSVNVAQNFLTIIVVIITLAFESGIQQYEPFQDLIENTANFMNSVEGQARVTRNCELKDHPNGHKKLGLPEDSIVTVYKINDESTAGWSKVKFNKDGHDITGYVKTSELQKID